MESGVSVSSALMDFSRFWSPLRLNECLADFGIWNSCFNERPQ